MIGLDPDPVFEALVEGKRIAVVGPARTLAGKRQGPLIESFDLVVRFNEAFDYLGSSGALAADYGTRADIVYCNQVILRTHVLGRRWRRKELAYAFRRLGTKFLVCTNNSLSYGPGGEPTATCPAADRNVIHDVNKWMNDAGLAVRCRVVHAPSAILHRWLEGQWARTGFIGLFDLLMFESRRLYVTGMTFYHDGGHLLTNEAAVLHPLKNRDGSWARSAAGIGHDSYREREIMRLLAQWYRHRLGVDEDLLKILGYTTAPDLWPAESPTSSASNTTEPS